MSDFQPETPEPIGRSFFASDGARTPGIGEECTAASVWRLAISPVAETLISTTDRRVIERGIAPLPACSAMIIERSLGTAPCIDLSLCTIRGDGSNAVLAGYHRSRDLPPSWLTQPVWRSIRDHYRHWMQPGSMLHENVPSTWLEFDYNQLASGCSLPSVFVDFRTATADSQQPLCDIILAGFVAPTARAMTGAALHRILSVLPRQAQPQFLGVMLPRDQTTVRFCVTLPGSELMAFAAGIGLAAGDEMRRLVAFSARHTVATVLHVDVGERLGETLGIELKPRDGEDWAPLMSDLHREGLCTATERDAVLGFPGRSAIVRNSSAPIATADLTLGSPDLWRDVDACVIVRSLNHLKLVCRPDRTPVAKAYLHIGYLWRKRLAPCR